MTSFWGRHQITSHKIRHKNDVTKVSIFKSTPLSKILVAPLRIIMKFLCSRSWWPQL